MGRIVILEGPDGGGKTTLAKKLVDMGFDYRHEGPPKQGADLVAHYLKIIDDSLKSPRPVVHDRLWLGERIYGPIARGKDNLGIEGQNLFYRLHRSKHINMYIVMPKIDIARQNYKEKLKEKDDYLKGVKDHALSPMSMWEMVFTKYAQWMYQFGNLGMTYDYTKDTPERIYKDSLSTEKIILPDGTIGTHWAEYLFIGDQPNHDSIDIPFFALNGSSGYLNRAIEFAGIKESQLALSNAYSVTGEQHSLGPILCNLPHLKRIFLLGNKAKEWFWKQTDGNTNLPFKVDRLPHPSFLKRFKGHNPWVMSNLILDSMKK